LIKLSLISESLFFLFSGQVLAQPIDAPGGLSPFPAPKSPAGAKWARFVGTRDDYEEGERPCDAFVAMLPASAREKVIVRYVEGTTHGFDSQTPARQFYDQLVHAGRGGMVSVIPSPKDAAEARQAVVSFFVKHLKP